MRSRLLFPPVWRTRNPPDMSPADRCHYSQTITSFSSCALFKGWCYIFTAEPRNARCSRLAPIYTSNAPIYLTFSAPGCVIFNFTGESALRDGNAAAPPPPPTPVAQEAIKAPADRTSPGRPSASHELSKRKGEILQHLLAPRFWRTAFTTGGHQPRPPTPPLRFYHLHA